MRNVQHQSLESLVKMDHFQKEPPLNLKGPTGAKRSEMPLRLNIRFGSLADTLRCGSDVRFTPTADMCSASVHVRFVPKADISYAQKKSPPRGVPSWNLGRSVRVDNHDLSERRSQGQTRRQVLHIVDYPRRHCARYRHCSPCIHKHGKLPRPRRAPNNPNCSRSGVLKSSCWNSA